MDTEKISQLTFPLERFPGQLLGMTPLNEQKAYYEVVRDLYTGRGPIVELGCWLGSLSIPMARALRERKLPAPKLIALDIFLWDYIMEDAVKNTPLAGVVEEGEVFQDLYRLNLADLGEFVESHQVDLCKPWWDRGPIEFLVNDAMKYPKVTINILRDFYPHLQAGSILAYQDYFHFYEAWSHLLAFRHRDYLEPIRAVTNCGSYFFRVKAPIPADLLHFPWQFDAFAVDEIKEAFAWSRTICPEISQGTVTAAEIMMYVHAKKNENAIELFRQCAKTYARDTQFNWMTDYVRGRGVPL